MTPAGQYPGPDGDGQPSAEDLFSTRPAASPAEVRNALRAQMGEDVPRAPQRPDYPGIHQLAQDLGLA